MLIILIISAALFGAIGQYIDKHLVNMGISRKDYFYYMCLSMLPFAGIMIAIEVATNQFRFSFEIIPILLLVVAMFLRYNKQKTIVGCLTHLNPYEDSAYLTLGLLIAFIIDVLLGIQSLRIISVISIILTIVGVFLIANAKLKIKSLRLDILIRIATSLLMGYVTHYILNYWSNAMFLFVLNLLLTLIFSKDYKFNYYKKQNNIIKWVFIQQAFGFTSLYLSNILMSNSVTLSNYVRPTSIIIVLLIALMFKDKEKRPTIRQVFGIILIVTGIFLIK
jgi:drug/metabolite transporter (DMT)-like permease